MSDKNIEWPAIENDQPGRHEAAATGFVALVQAAMRIQQAGDDPHPDLSLASRNFLIAAFKERTEP